MHTTTPPAKRGRPPLDPSGAQQPVRVRLTPDEQARLRAEFGSVNAGIRKILSDFLAAKPPEKQGKRK
jgi:hypothetical protein